MLGTIYLDPVVKTHIPSYEFSIASPGTDTVLR
jgi:hypothetical protein